MKVGEIFNLDDIMLSPRIYDSYLLSLPVQIHELIKKASQKGIVIDSKNIPNEQFRIVDKDGNGEIFVDLPGGFITSFKVPFSEWTFGKE